MKPEFTVTTEGNYYLVSIGVGKKFRAENLDEVARALQHYFQVDLFTDVMGKFDYQEHLEHAKECLCCPFCRDMKEKEKGRR